MTASTSTLDTTSARSLRLRTRAFAVGGAVAIALAGWVVAVPLLDVELRASMNGVGSAPQVIGPPLIATVTLVASLLGWALLELLEWRTRRARRIWTVTALVVLVVSLGGPLSAAVGIAAKITLTLLHLAVAAVVIPVLRRSSPTR